MSELRKLVLCQSEQFFEFYDFRFFKYLHFLRDPWLHLNYKNVGDTMTFQLFSIYLTWVNPSTAIFEISLFYYLLKLWYQRQQKFLRLYGVILNILIQLRIVVGLTRSSNWILANTTIRTSSRKTRNFPRTSGCPSNQGTFSNTQITLVRMFKEKKFRTILILVSST